MKNLRRWVRGKLKVTGFGALSIMALFGGGNMLRQCAPTPPSINCSIMDERTHPDRGSCGVWGSPGYAYVTVGCSDEQRSVMNPNPAIKASYDSPWVRFEGGGDSMNPGTYLTRYCSYQYPYIVSVNGGTSVN